MRTHACTSAVVSGKQTADRRPLHVRGVVAVERQLGRPVADTVGRQRAAQVVDERRRGSASAATVTGSRLAHQDRPGADATGLPSTSTSSPGCRWSSRRTTRPSRSAAQLALADAAASRPSRTASTTRGPVRRALRDRAPGDVGRAPASWAARRRPCAWRSRHRRHRWRRRRRTSTVRLITRPSGNRCDRHRDVPVASPAALITGADRAVRVDAAAALDASPLIASAEPSTRSKRSRSARAVVDRRPAPRRPTAQLGQQRLGLGPEVGDLGAQVAQRVAHPHQRHDQRGERRACRARPRRPAPARRRSSPPPRRSPHGPHALGDLLLVAVAAGPVPAPSDELVGKVLLVDPTTESFVVVGMRVLVARRRGR